MKAEPSANPVRPASEGGKKGNEASPLGLPSLRNRHSLGWALTRTRTGAWLVTSLGTRNYDGTHWINDLAINCHPHQACRQCGPSGYPLVARTAPHVWAYRRAAPPALPATSQRGDAAWIDNWAKHYDKD